MIDLFTKITMKIGQDMSKNETNTLYEAKSQKSSNWKYDVVLSYIAANLSKRDLVSKCVELAKDLNLEETNTVYISRAYWKDLIEDLQEGTKKELKKEVEDSIKKITYQASDYGCGSSRSSYGCGSSSGNSYSSYGCGGGGSSRYGC